jgi:hypothetical protein
MNISRFNQDGLVKNPTFGVLRLKATPLRKDRIFIVRTGIKPAPRNCSVQCRLIVGKSLEILIQSGPSFGDGRKTSMVNRLRLGGFVFVKERIVAWKASMTLCSQRCFPPR